MHARDWRYYRRFVATGTGFGLGELTALDWDEFLDEVLVAMRLRKDMGS